MVKSAKNVAVKNAEKYPCLINAGPRIKRLVQIKAGSVKTSFKQTPYCKHFIEKIGYLISLTKNGLFEHIEYIHVKK